MAFIAAQDGTPVGLGTVEGDATGLGLGVGLAIGLALGLASALGLECDGLGCEAIGPLGVQPAIEIAAHARINPRFTGAWNARLTLAVTRAPKRCNPPRIGGEAFSLNDGSRIAVKLAGVLAAVLFASACSDPVPLTASVSTVASTTSTVGGPAQLVVTVTNTGPTIPQLGLVFRTQDRWYETHKMSDLSGCAVVTDESAFDCGDLKAKASKTFSFAGVASSVGTFHYELAIRELVQPFNYVNQNADGPDLQVWDESVTAG